MAETDNTFENIQLIEASILSFGAVCYAVASIVASGGFLGIQFWRNKASRNEITKANRHRFTLAVIATSMVVQALAIWIIWNKIGVTEREHDEQRVEYARWVGFIIYTDLLVFSYCLYTQISMSYSLGAILFFTISNLFGLFGSLTSGTNIWFFTFIIWGLTNAIGVVSIAVSRNIKVLPWYADIFSGILLEVMFLLNGLWLVLGPEVSGLIALWVATLLYTITSTLTAIIPCGIIAVTFWGTKALGISEDSILVSNSQLSKIQNNRGVKSKASLQSGGKMKLKHKRKSFGK